MRPSSGWAKPMAVAALAACAVMAPDARAGIAITMEPAAPGSSDVALRWAADGGSTAPYNLLRLELPLTERAADALPLDPVRDVYVSDLSGGALILPGEAEPTAEPTMRVYQLVDDAGGCSNVGWIVTRGYMVPQPTWWSSAVSVALPRLSAWRSLGDVLRHFPAVPRVQVTLATGCRTMFLERRPAGGFRGEDVALPPGMAVMVHVAAVEQLVVVGASSPAGASDVVRLPATSCARPALYVALPYATTLNGAVELFCGREGADWVDADSDGVPDTCRGGLHSHGGYPSTVIRTAAADSPNVWRDARAWDTPTGELTIVNSIPRIPPSTGLHFGWGTSSTASAALVVEDAGAMTSCRCRDTDGDGEDDCVELLMGTNPADALSHGPDADRDGIPDDMDACPLSAAPLSGDADADGADDTCDPCPGDPTNACVDPDGDTLPEGEDNCDTVANVNQLNGDGDVFGDACDVCPFHADSQADFDGDGVGDVCDGCVRGDPDGDGACNDFDNCPEVVNTTQADFDGDGLGDACDCILQPGTTPREPSEITGLRVSAVGGVPYVRLLSWDDPRPIDHVEARFDVLGGPLADLWAGGSFASVECVDADLAEPRVVDAFLTASRWYLVRATNPCGLGTVGRGWPEEGAPSRAWLDDSANDPCP